MPDINAFLRTHGRPFFSVAPDDTVGVAARKFGEKTGGRKYSLAVVCEEGDRPVGVIGLGDLVYALGQHESAASGMMVRDVMTSDVLTAGLGDDIREVLRTMAENDIRHMPVTADGKLVGLVSRRDALEFLFDADSLELEQLRSFVFRSGARY